MKPTDAEVYDALPVGQKMRVDDILVNVISTRYGTTWSGDHMSFAKRLDSDLHDILNNLERQGKIRYTSDLYVIRDKP